MADTAATPIPRLAPITDTLAEIHCALAGVLDYLSQSERIDPTTLRCLMAPHIKTLGDSVEALEHARDHLRAPRNNTTAALQAVADVVL